MTSVAANRPSERDRVEVDDARPVTAPGDEAQQIGGRDRGGAVVFERMIIQRIVLDHALVKHDRDPRRIAYYWEQGPLEQFRKMRAKYLLYQ